MFSDYLRATDVKNIFDRGAVLESLKAIRGLHRGLCNLSARGRAGATEAKPPASDRAGAAASGHGGRARAVGHGGCAAACIQGSVRGAPGY